MRGLDVRLRVGVGRGAHASFVGEETALRALRERRFQRVAEAAADDGLRLEGIPENHAERCGDIADADNEHDARAREEDRRHDRHDLFRNGGKTAHAAEEDGAAENDERNADDPCRHAERSLKRGADGVGLHHAAHEAERKDDGDGEEAREELSEAALKGRRDVIDRAAVDRAVLVDLPGGQRERRLGINGGHAEKGDDPHPEDGAGAAGQYSAGRADDVAGADLRGDGGGERLKGAHAAFMLLAAEREIAEHAAHPLAEAAHLHKARADRVPEPDGDEKKDENIVGKVCVEIAYHGVKRVFDGGEHVRDPP